MAPHLVGINNPHQKEEPHHLKAVGNDEKRDTQLVSRMCFHTNIFNKVTHVYNCIIYLKYV